MTPKKEAGPEWREAFIAALRTIPVVRVACQAAGISRKTAYQWRKNDAAFAEEWQEAQDDGIDMLEVALHKRAREMDTTAAIFLLKCLRPERYRDRQVVEHAGSIGRSDVPDDQLDLRIRAVEATLSAHGNGNGNGNGTGVH